MSFFLVRNHIGLFFFRFCIWLTKYDQNFYLFPIFRLTMAVNGAIFIRHLFLPTSHRSFGRMHSFVNFHSFSCSWIWMGRELCFFGLRTNFWLSPSLSFSFIKFAHSFVSHQFVYLPHAPIHAHSLPTIKIIQTALVLPLICCCALTRI